MTTLPFTRALAARRAILRWAWRMFRREWRQQLLVLGLLAVAVLAAVASVAVVHGIAVPNQATFGDARARLVLDASDPAPVAAGQPGSRRRAAGCRVRVPGGGARQPRW
ncbi:MAG TPA: hypothetical protein VKY81_10090 [Natronosporangium sp.]|nr:hypothetical protein [Natronosporangium sp.]